MVAFFKHVFHCIWFLDHILTSAKRGTLQQVAVAAATRLSWVFYSIHVMMFMPGFLSSKTYEKKIVKLYAVYIYIYPI